MTKVSDTEKQMQKLAKDLAAKNSKVDEIAKQLENLLREFSENQEEYESLVHSVESNNLKIQSLVDQMALFQSQFEDDNRMSDPKNSGITTIAQNLTETNQKIDSLKNEIARVNESIFLLRSDEKEINEKLERHEDELLTAKSKIELFSNQSLPVVTGKIESFQVQLQNFADTIGSLSEAISESAPKFDIGSDGHRDVAGSADLAEMMMQTNQRLDGLEKSLVANCTQIAELRTTLESISKRASPSHGDGPSRFQTDVLDYGEF